MVVPVPIPTCDPSSYNKEVEDKEVGEVHLGIKLGVPLDKVHETDIHAGFPETSVPQNLSGLPLPALTMPAAREVLTPIFKGETPVPFPVRGAFTLTVLSLLLNVVQSVFCN